MPRHSQHKHSFCFRDIHEIRFAVFFYNDSAVPWHLLCCSFHWKITYLGSSEDFGCRVRSERRNCDSRQGCGFLFLGSKWVEHVGHCGTIENIERYGVPMHQDMLLRFAE